VLVGLLVLGSLRVSASNGVLRPAPRRARQATPLLLACSLGALVAAILMSLLLSSGYAVRYSSAMIAPALLLAALGITRLRRRSRTVALIVVLVCGAVGVTQQHLSDKRTQAEQTASALGAAAPGDVVLYCPDQLGPAVDRVLAEPVTEIVYPTLGEPQLIDWVDYAERNAAAKPADIARTISDGHAGRIWLVTAPDYRTFGRKCEQLAGYLAVLRGGRTDIQDADPTYYEQQSILLFPAPTTR
jgi:mannosyltransferase